MNMEMILVVVSIIILTSIFSYQLSKREANKKITPKIRDDKIMTALEALAIQISINNHTYRFRSGRENIEADRRAINKAWEEIARAKRRNR